MPTLALLRPRLNIGALVVVDNLKVNLEGYQDLWEYLTDPRNGFKITTAPYKGGLGIAVYLGHSNL